MRLRDRIKQRGLQAKKDKEDFKKNFGLEDVKIGSDRIKFSSFLEPNIWLFHPQFPTNLPLSPSTGLRTTILTLKMSLNRQP